MLYIHRLTQLRSYPLITLCITLVLSSFITSNVYASPQLATPISGITTFNSFPNSYTEYARTTTGASGFTAANLAGWDISLFAPPAVMYLSFPVIIGLPAAMALSSIWGLTVVEHKPSPAYVLPPMTANCLTSMQLTLRMTVGPVRRQSVLPLLGI